jgi:excisionase family DNA binding protein
VDTLLTVDEAARALRVSRATLYKRIATGQVRAIRLGTGEKAPLRIAEDELDRYTLASTIGDDVAHRAEQLVARRGEDPGDADAYARALRDLNYDEEVFADRVGHMVHEDMEAANLAAGHRAVGTHQRTGSDIVDVEKIMLEELAKLGDPLPVEISKLGPRGLGREALRILHDQGVSEYDAAGYRKAVRQAISEALHPKRGI